MADYAIKSCFCCLLALPMRHKQLKLLSWLEVKSHRIIANDLRERKEKNIKIFCGFYAFLFFSVFASFESRRCDDCGAHWRMNMTASWSRIKFKLLWLDENCFDVIKSDTWMNKMYSFHVFVAAVYFWRSRRLSHSLLFRLIAWVVICNPKNSDFGEREQRNERSERNGKEHETSSRWLLNSIFVRFVIELLLSLDLFDDSKMSRYQVQTVSWLKLYKFCFLFFLSSASKNFSSIDRKKHNKSTFDSFTLLSFASQHRNIDWFFASFGFFGFFFFDSSFDWQRTIYLCSFHRCLWWTLFCTSKIKDQLHLTFAVLSSKWIKMMNWMTCFLLLSNEWKSDRRLLSWLRFSSIWFQFTPSSCDFD